MTMVATMPPVLQGDYAPWASPQCPDYQWTIDDSLLWIASQFPNITTPGETIQASDQTYTTTPQKTSYPRSNEISMSTTSNDSNRTATPDFTSPSTLDLTSLISATPAETDGTRQDPASQTTPIQTPLPAQTGLASLEHRMSMTSLEHGMGMTSLGPVSSTQPGQTSWTTGSLTRSCTTAVTMPAVENGHKLGCRSDVNTTTIDRSTKLFSIAGEDAEWTASEQKSWGTAAMSDSRPAGQKRGCGSSEDDTTLRENERAKRLCMLEDDITDPEVKAAGDQAVKDGSLAPLTKNMLKTKIRHRRLQEGKPELPDDDLFKPPPTYELTSEEKRKIRERKERNRKAAHKSRMNRKMRSHDLQKENKELQALNQRLKEEVEKLRKAATERMKAVHAVRLCAVSQQQRSCIMYPPHSY